MSWSILGWSLAILAGPPALYGLHRLGLWLEDRGYIYYLYKKPKGSSASCFVALQKAIEPQVQHVLHVERKEGLRAETPGGKSADGQERA
jgi:hypothetical protein